MVTPTINFADLDPRLKGEIHTGDLMRRIYSTDTSEYQEMPLAVALVEAESDLPTLIRFARQHRLSLIPRAAGTSLAGQVVGNGLVVDLGRLNKIISVDAEQRRVRVQPGVVRNELNQFLQTHGLCHPQCFRH